MACLRELMPVAFILQWVGELACYGTNLDRWIDPARKVLKKPGVGTHFTKVVSPFAGLTL
jgi:hypothetical protein